jgi:hypothetical protein
MTSRASPGFKFTLRVTIECGEDMIGHRQYQAGFKFSADDLPERLSGTIS